MGRIEDFVKVDCVPVLPERPTAPCSHAQRASVLLLTSLPTSQFDAVTAEVLFGMLAEVRDADRFAEVGEFIVDCATGLELLGRGCQAAVRRA